MKYSEYPKEVLESSNLILRDYPSYCSCGEKTRWFDLYLNSYVCSTECYYMMMRAVENVDNNRPQ